MRKHREDKHAFCRMLLHQVRQTIKERKLKAPKIVAILGDSVTVMEDGEYKVLSF